MFRFSSRWLVIPAAAIGVGAILFAEPSDGRRNDTDNDQVLAATDPVAHAQAREANRVNEIFAMRINYKEKLVYQLIVGQTTLDLVAQEFLRLNREVPATLKTIRMQYPKASDEEGAALNVIDFILQRIVTPEQHTTVLARVGAEFRKLYGHDSQNLN